MTAINKLYRTGLFISLFFSAIFALLPNAYPTRVWAAVPAQIESMELRQDKWISLKIPQLQSGMVPERLAFFNEQFRQTVFSRLTEFQNNVFEARLVPQMPDAVKDAMLYMSDYAIHYNQKNKLSLSQRWYQYTGGAHGMTWLKAKTIDLTSGKALLLSDLFKPGSDFAERFNRKLNHTAKTKQWPMWDFRGIDAQQEFFLTDVGVVVFFQLYAIAPYSEGIITITIPYSELADILQTEP